MTDLSFRLLAPLLMSSGFALGRLAIVVSRLPLDSGPFVHKRQTQNNVLEASELVIRQRLRK